MNGFIWGAFVGYLFAQAMDIRRHWRAAKAKVNEVRQQHGMSPEKRWWRL